MATILQCRFCNMPFQSLGGKICPNCLDQIDLDFTTIRDYLYEHPGVFDIDRISEETEVKKKFILHLIEEKRLTFSTPEGGVFSCRICHRPIEEGTMCDDCKGSLSITLGSTISAPEKSDEKKPLTSKRSGAKMHLRSNDKK